MSKGRLRRGEHMGGKRKVIQGKYERPQQGQINTKILVQVTAGVNMGDCCAEQVVFLQKGPPRPIHAHGDQPVDGGRRRRSWAQEAKSEQLSHYAVQHIICTNVP